MKKVLFVAYGGGHIKIIEPIAHKLLESKNVDFKILALTTAYEMVLNKFPEGIVKKISDYSFLFDKFIDRILKLGLELLDDNYGENSSVKKEETIYYIGFSMYDLIKRLGKEKAYKLYSEKKRQAFLPISIIEKILEYEEIDIVVSTTSPRFEEASFIAANNLGIETVEILDLFGDLYPLPEAKHIICMNENVSNTLKKRGLSQKKYYHYGQPALENSCKLIMNLDSKKIFPKIDNINIEKPTILYASHIPLIYDENGITGEIADYQKLNRKIFDFLKRIYLEFDVNIIFRIHPNEEFANYEKFFREYGEIIFVNKKLTLYESIAISNFVITQYSTVAVEAVLSNKVTFTYKSDFDICYPERSMMIPPFIYSDNMEQLYDNVKSIIIGKNKMINQKSLFEFGSVEKISNFLEEL